MSETKPLREQPKAPPSTDFGSRLSRVVPSKLSAPRTNLRSVERAVVSSMLDTAGNARLVLFRAPSGFGKTTAMRQLYDLLERSGRAVAWLNLDHLDDDYRRLLVHVVAAFDQVLAPAESSDPGAERHGGIDPDQQAFELVDRIERSGNPFTVFIDDYEAIGNRAIDELIRLVLDRLPDQGQLVIGTRKMPELQVGRLRAQGELVEIDQLQLRFTLQETDALLRAQEGLMLTVNDVARLHGVTEGWPAAIWLARLALADRPRPSTFIDSFSGTDTAVAEYLTEEVLSQLPVDVQQFLLQTSVLGELTPELCDAVRQRHDSAQLLAQLEKSNGCVQLIDPERRLFRYHGLFASFLRAQLDRLGGSELPELNRRASEWFRKAGRPIPAIDHALTGGFTNAALRLLAEHSNSLLFDGRFHFLARSLERVPEGALDSTPALRITQVWALTFTHNSAEALRRLDALESADRLGQPALPVEMRQELDALRPYILAILDRHEEGCWLGEEALKLDWSRESFAYNLLATIVATWRVAASRYAEAIELLSDVQVQKTGGRTSFPVVYAMCIEGLVEMLQGRTREAIAQFRVAFGNAAATYGSRSMGKSIVAIFLAEALYEVDELQEAEQILALYLPIVREYGLPDQLILAHIIQARIAFDRGDVDHAFRRLSELELIGRQDRLPRTTAMAQLERARLALLRDDTAEAQIHLRRAEQPDTWKGLRGFIMPSNDVETLELARYRLAARGVGREEALAAIRVDIRTAQTQHRNRRALKLRILLACILQGAGYRRQAHRTMQEAVEAARPEGLLRAFVDEGNPVMDLIREIRVAQASNDGDTDAAAQFMDRILARGGISVDLEPEGKQGLDASITLTTREVKVLESVAMGKSNMAIAESMFVSETTVRAHLRKVNVKLGASNRTQAVALARRLGLIR